MMYQAEDTAGISESAVQQVRWLSSLHRSRGCTSVAHVCCSAGAKRVARLAPDPAGNASAQGASHTHNPQQCHRITVVMPQQHCMPSGRPQVAATPRQHLILAMHMQAKQQQCGSCAPHCQCTHKHEVHSTACNVSSDPGPPGATGTSPAGSQQVVSSSKQQHDKMDGHSTGLASHTCGGPVDTHGTLNGVASRHTRCVTLEHQQAGLELVPLCTREATAPQSARLISTALLMVGKQLQHSSTSHPGLQAPSPSCFIHRVLHLLSSNRPEQGSCRGCNPQARHAAPANPRHPWLLAQACISRGAGRWVPRANAHAAQHAKHDVAGPASPGIQSHMQ